MLVGGGWKSRKRPSWVQISRAEARRNARKRFRYHDGGHEQPVSGRAAAGLWPGLYQRRTAALEPRRGEGFSL